MPTAYFGVVVVFCRHYSERAEGICGVWGNYLIAQLDCVFRGCRDIRKTRSGYKKYPQVHRVITVNFCCVAGGAYGYGAFAFSGTQVAANG